MRFFSREVYPEPYEILRCAQNDRKGEGLLQNDMEWDEIATSLTLLAMTVKRVAPRDDSKKSCSSR
jgi:hypothetical protein